MNLPKKYNTDKEEYKHLNELNKISYSQYTSYKDPQYRPDYYVQYFSGIQLGGNMFSDFGSMVGTTVEAIAKGLECKTRLSENCIKIIQEKIDYPDNCEYEEEVVIQLTEDLCCQGFIDRTWYKDEGVEIRDYKTLNLDKKKDYYSSEDYSQTAIYCYHKATQGYKILNSEVAGLGRKGNSWDGKYPLRLSGDIVYIPTPYSDERAQKALSDIRETAEKISRDYEIFLKYFK